MAAVEVMATYPSDRNKIISEKKEKVAMKPVQVSFHPNLQILDFLTFIHCGSKTQVSWPIRNKVKKAI